MNLNHYLQDGAGKQARAVMCMLQELNIESSWNTDHKCYQAEVQIGRWENCREQGYVVQLRGRNYSRQLNIAFFEHRNSDSICAVKWEQRTTNTPNIESAQFGDVYKTKHDVSKSVNYGQIIEMTEWIASELVSWYEATEREAQQAKQTAQP